MTKSVTASLWCLTLGYVVAVLLSGLMQPVGTTDESLPWVSALQIRRHMAPHTDFWSPYPPLTYWLLAGVFSVLGDTAVAGRLLGTVFFLVLLIAVTLLARRNFGARSWQVPYAVLLAVLGAGPIFVYAFGIALAASLCALLSYFIVFRSRPALTLIPGFILAITLLLRMNFAAYAAAAIILDLALVKKLRFAGFIVGPMLIALLVYFVPYQGTMGVVWNQIVTVPRDVLAHTRFIPLPDYLLYYAAIALPLAWFSLRMLAGDHSSRLSYAPLGIAGAVCAAAYLARSNAALLPAISLAVLTGVVLLDRYVFRLRRTERGLLALYALFLHYILFRADEWHLRPLLALIGLLLPFLILPWILARGRTASLLLAGTFLALIVVPLWKLHSFRPDRPSMISAVNLIRAGEFIHKTPDSERFLGAGAAMLRPEWQQLFPDLEELKALRYVYARTTESDCVYVGVPKHASVFVADIRAYWLLHRCIGVKRFVLEPGVTTTEPEEEEMIRNLQQNRVRWVVLTPPVRGDEAFLRNPIPGSDLLDAAIALHYQVAATFGSYTVLTATGF